MKIVDAYLDDKLKCCHMNTDEVYCSMIKGWRYLQHGLLIQKHTRGRVICMKGGTRGLIEEPSNQLQSTSHTIAFGGSTFDIYAVYI